MRLIPAAHTMSSPVTGIDRTSGRTSRSRHEVVRPGHEVRVLRLLARLRPVDRERERRPERDDRAEHVEEDEPRDERRPSGDLLVGPQPAVARGRRRGRTPPDRIRRATTPVQCLWPAPADRLGEPGPVEQRPGPPPGPGHAGPCRLRGRQRRQDHAPSLALRLEVAGPPPDAPGELAGDPPGEVLEAGDPPIPGREDRRTAGAAGGRGRRVPAGERSGRPRPVGSAAEARDARAVASTEGRRRGRRRRPRFDSSSSVSPIGRRRSSARRSSSRAACAVAARPKPSPSARTTSRAWSPVVSAGGPPPSSPASDQRGRRIGRVGLAGPDRRQPSALGGGDPGEVLGLPGQVDAGACASAERGRGAHRGRRSGRSAPRSSRRDRRPPAARHRRASSHSRPASSGSRTAAADRVDDRRPRSLGRSGHPFAGPGRSPRQHLDRGRPTVRGRPQAHRIAARRRASTGRPALPAVNERDVRDLRTVLADACSAGPSAPLSSGYDRVRTRAPIPRCPTGCTRPARSASAAAWTATDSGRPAPASSTSARTAPARAARTAGTRSPAAASSAARSSWPGRAAGPPRPPGSRRDRHRSPRRQWSADRPRTTRPAERRPTAAADPRRARARHGRRRRTGRPTASHRPVAAWPRSLDSRSSRSCALAAVVGVRAVHVHRRGGRVPGRGRDPDAARPTTRLGHRRRVPADRHGRTRSDRSVAARQADRATAGADPAPAGGGTGGGGGGGGGGTGGPGGGGSTPGTTPTPGPTGTAGPTARSDGPADARPDAGSDAHPTPIRRRIRHRIRRRIQRRTRRRTPTPDPTPDPTPTP